MDNTSITNDVQCRSTRYQSCEQYEESELVSFILTHRTKSAFEDWEKEEIARSVRVSKAHERLYVSSSGGKIDGILVAFYNGPQQIWVDGFLALNKKAFKKLTLDFIEDNYFMQVLGRRHESIREFNLDGIRKQLTKE